MNRHYHAEALKFSTPAFALGVRGVHVFGRRSPPAMLAVPMEPSVYEYPSIFRRVHMEKPGEIEEETAFLKKVWRRHLKKPVRSVLDIAAGDSPHGQILAHQGIRVVGIDRSPTMIAAGKKGSRDAAGVRFYRREINKFSIPERPFDVAFFMSETFPVLITNDDLLSHLRSVGRLLRRGGVYCIDVDKMDRIRMVRERKRWQRRKVRTDDATIDVTTYDRPFPWYSTIQSIFELECQIKFRDRRDHAVTTRDIIPIRYTVPPLLELAAKASRMFEMIAVYADLSFEAPLAECERRWLGVLRRV
jgi:SAM-dependent methyltransferase